MKFLFAVTLLLFACNPQPKTSLLPGPAAVTPQVEEAPVASARAQITPPQDEQAEPPVIKFKRSMLTPEGLWNSQVEELEVVKNAIELEGSWIERPLVEGCEWGPLQSGGLYEWTWINCHANALALFRKRDGTWTLLKIPKDFDFRNQEGCGERYIGAREHVVHGQTWLIWSWEVQNYLESEEFVDECDDDGSCSGGRTGETSSHENLRGYDVVIKPEDAGPYLVMRSRLELNSITLDGGSPVSVKGTQLQIEATYLGDEVQATHRLAKINGKHLDAETSGGNVMYEFNKNGRGMIGKAKLVKKVSEPLKPVEWDKIECCN